MRIGINIIEQDLATPDGDLVASRRFTAHRESTFVCIFGTT